MTKLSEQLSSLKQYIKPGQVPNLPTVRLDYLRAIYKDVPKLLFEDYRGFAKFFTEGLKIDDYIYRGICKTNEIEDF